MPSLPATRQSSDHAVAGSRFASLGPSVFYRGHVEAGNADTVSIKVWEDVCEDGSSQSVHVSRTPAAHNHRQRDRDRARKPRHHHPSWKEAHQPDKRRSHKGVHVAVRQRRIYSLITVPARCQSLCWSAHFVPRSVSVRVERRRRRRADRQWHGPCTTGSCCCCF